jgi:hypothetical protein
VGGLLRHRIVADIVAAYERADLADPDRRGAAGTPDGRGRNSAAPPTGSTVDARRRD